MAKRERSRIGSVWGIGPEGVCCVCGRGLGEQHKRLGVRANVSGGGGKGMGCSYIYLKTK